MGLKPNHFDENGNAYMIDVSEKEITRRIAVASGKIKMSKEAMDAVIHHDVKKGDVLCVARIAGIMALKRTSEMIPLCHPLAISSCSIEFEIKQEENIIVSTCMVKIDGKTGVEMEALTGVMISLLTIYDMCKGIDKSLEITDVHLVKKSGGKSGDIIIRRDG